MNQRILLVLSQIFLFSMKAALVNLSDKIFEDSRFRLNDSAIKYGIDLVFSYDFAEIMGTEFFQKNKKILEQPKGLGYWLWKPFIIFEVLNKISDGDVVVYSDCGIEIVDRLDSLIEICSEKQPVMLFSNGDLVNAQWTRRDCFILMNADSKKYWFSLQCDAAFALFRKSPESIAFVKEWLFYCSDERIISDLPNSCGKRNLPGFLEHRRDQSVLSILAKKHKIELFRCPTQYGNHYKAQALRIKGEFNCLSQFDQKQVSFYSKTPFINSPYHQLLNHQRTPRQLEANNPETQTLYQRVIVFAIRKWKKTLSWVHRVIICRYFRSDL
jgi:hypothetical protein